MWRGSLTSWLRPIKSVKWVTHHPAQAKPMERVVSALVNDQNTNSTNDFYSLPRMSAGTLASHLHEDGDPAGARAPATARASANAFADKQQYLFDRISDIYREYGELNAAINDELTMLETPRGSQHLRQHLESGRIRWQRIMLYKQARS